MISIINFLNTHIFCDIFTTITTVILAVIVYLLSKFYIRVFELPPGPIPVPYFGNTLLFKCEHHWDVVIKRQHQKYGPLFTFWMGPKPFIFIADIETAKKVYQRWEFAGRPDSYFGSQLSNDKFADVVFTDYGPKWEALRKVAHLAVQKLANNDRLVDLVNDCVDRTIELIIKNEGIGQPFKPIDYTYHLFLNMLATSAFGHSYDLEDSEYKKIKYVLRDFGREAGNRFSMWEFSSLIRLWDRQLVLKQRCIIEEVMLMIRNKFRKHNDDYNELIERDFCDALITSRNVSLRDGKQWASYLTDENLAMIVYDLFFAGNDTTQRTFQWLLLLIAYYPDVQKRLKDEIESHIGDRRARHEDRQQCPYTMAMMAETLRYRNVARFGVTHKAMVDTKIGEIFVRKGTDVGVYQGIILDSSDYWDKPDMFRPERFLDSDGNYMTNRPQAYIPFGLGRRVCLGERLAIADLFLVLVRFLQLTKDYDIILNSHNGLDPDPNVAESYLPKEYTICFKNKN